MRREQIGHEGGEVVGDERRRRVRAPARPGRGRRCPRAPARTASRARSPSRRRSTGGPPPSPRRSPSRSRTSAAVGGSGLPATSGVRPDAVAIAATIDPAPGQHVIRARVGRVGVGRDEARAVADRVPTRGPGRRSRSCGASRRPPHRPDRSSTTVEARRARAPRSPRARRTRSTVAPGASVSVEQRGRGLRAGEHVVGLGGDARCRASFAR